MARPLRIEFDGAWYHVMNRGAGRKRIFLVAADFNKFVKLLGELTEVFQLEIHAYCLMRNHYHLLVRTPEAGLARAMRHLNGVYTQFFNKRSGRDGPLFRGRYRAILVESDSYQLQVSRYIHLNPVESNLASRPEEYIHSSYRAYLDPRWAPDWLATSAILSRFERHEPRAAYRRFVDQGIDASTREFYAARRMVPVLGGDEFRSRIGARVETAKPTNHQEIPDARRVRSRPDLAAVTDAVAKALEIEVRSLRAASRMRTAKLTLARGAALYLGRHLTGAPLASIAAWMGYSSYSTAATALSRFRRRLEEPAVRVILQRARSLMYKVET